MMNRVCFLLAMTMVLASPVAWARFASVSPPPSASQKAHKEIEVVSTEYGPMRACGFVFDDDLHGRLEKWFDYQVGRMGLAEKTVFLAKLKAGYTGDTNYARFMAKLNAEYEAQKAKLQATYGKGNVLCRTQLKDDYDLMRELGSKTRELNAATIQEQWESYAYFAKDCLWPVTPQVVRNLEVGKRVVEAQRKVKPGSGCRNSDTYEEELPKVAGFYMGAGRYFKGSFDHENEGWYDFKRCLDKVNPLQSKQTENDWKYSHRWKGKIWELLPWMMKRCGGHEELHEWYFSKMGFYGSDR